MSNTQKSTFINNLENRTGGCVWIFMGGFYLFFIAAIVAMYLETKNALFIPFGFVLLALLITFNTFTIYKPLKLKKKIASHFFAFLPAQLQVKTTYPSLFKFTVSPRAEFKLDGKWANIRITQTRRSAMNQLLAMQLESNDAKLNTEFNSNYLIPGWKGNIFRIYFHWEQPSDYHLSLFAKTNISTSLSNNLIALTGSKLSECSFNDPGIDSWIGCYCDNPALIHALNNHPTFKSTIVDILKFNFPYITKLEINRKGVYIIAMLTSDINQDALIKLLNNLEQLMEIIRNNTLKNVS